MNSHPGKLTGGGIRELPAERRAGMLQRIKVEGSGKSRRVRSVRYRVTGFRDPDTGMWVSRDPKTGRYFSILGGGVGSKRGRHKTSSRPTGEKLARSDLISLEVEVDRGGKDGARIYFVSIPGLGG